MLWRQNVVLNQGGPGIWTVWYIPQDIELEWPWDLDSMLYPSRHWIGVAMGFGQHVTALKTLNWGDHGIWTVCYIPQDIELGWPWDLDSMLYPSRHWIGVAMGFGQYDISLKTLTSFPALCDLVRLFTDACIRVSPWSTPCMVMVLLQNWVICWNHYVITKTCVKGIH